MKVLRSLAATPHMLLVAISLGCRTSTPPAQREPAAQAAPPARLAPGNWSGTVTRPDGGTVRVKYWVADSAGATTIQFGMPSVGMYFPFTRVALDGPNLTFNFTPGDAGVKCTLLRALTGSYAGSCVDGNGEGAPITMVPPRPDALPRT